MTTLPTDYQNYIALSRYAKWIESEGRRETWDETVDRYMDNVVGNKLDGYDISRDQVRDAIINLEVMPSMRALMTAGPAMDRDNTCAYNCSYVPIESIEDFSETMFVLMCGTGVGFSVERQFINKLNEVPGEIEQTASVIKVHDSKEGWANSFKEFLTGLYNGKVYNFDTSDVRPEGSVLKTFGGRSSGPRPLEELMKFTYETFMGARGRKLNSVEVHDIVCKIGDCIVSGGVRRSALISLSNLSDQRMAQAKSGDWWTHNGQRALANNSVAYTEKPDITIFMQEWLELIKSQSGERGLFNRQAAKLKCDSIGRDSNYDFGVNPCAEILLRPRQFCNLSEVVVRPDDDWTALNNKVTIATVLGTIQSGLTDFKYLRDEWKQNCEEERLLGVSLTGIEDNTATRSPKATGLLAHLRENANIVNIDLSMHLGINPSKAVTTVKPSGTVSQLVDSASGIHPRYAEYYIRTVRGANTDPTTKFMVDQGVPHEPCVMKPDTTTVFSFPMKSPSGSTMRDQRTAIEQLDMWRMYATDYCDHSASITVYVREDEWLDVGAYVYKHFDQMTGVSFLPHTDHTYQQAPYQEVDVDAYIELKSRMPKIDWTKLSEYEIDDRTEGVQNLACVAGVCTFG